MRKQKGPLSKGGKFLYVLAGVAVILAVGIGVLSAVNIAGDTIANLSAEAIKKETGMQLSVREVKGNPIRGYVFSDVGLSSESGTRLFSAKKLGIDINFLSLFSASPRLSSLAVGGVDMDLDQLLAEIQKMQKPKSQGGGDIPIDRIRLQDSRFSARWGEIAVQDVSARIEGSLLDVSLAGVVNGIPVKGTFDIDAQGKSVSVNKAELGIGGGQLNFSGNVRPGSEPEASPMLDFQGSARGLRLEEATAFWPQYLPSQDFNGKLDLDFAVEGAGSNLVATSAVKFEGSRLGGYPAERLAGDLKYSGMRISFENVKLSSLGIPIEGTFAMAMSADGAPRISMKLDGSNASLANLSKLYPDLGNVSGKIDRFTINIQGPTNALSGMVEISAPDISILKKRITSLAAQIKLNQSDTATVNGKFLFEGAQAYVQGTIAQILTGASLNLTAKLVSLDVKKLKDLISDAEKLGLSGLLTADLTIKGRGVAPAVSGTLSSPQFAAMGYTLEKPSVTFVLDKNVLTLKDSGGSWNGLPIKARGTIGPLSSKTPAVNLTAQLAFKPENLKAFVPDIASYKLQGDIHAGVKIEGKLPSPHIDLVASSSALSALGLISVKNVEATTALDGDLSKLDKLSVTLRAGALAASGIGLSDLNAVIKKDGQKIELSAFSANSGEGGVSGGGTALLGGALDMGFDLQRLDLGALGRAGGAGVPLSGVLSGKITLGGTSVNPAVAFKGQVPRLDAAGLVLNGVDADISGNADALKINSFKADVGGAPLSASGTVRLGAPFKAALEIAGNGLDLAALTAGMAEAQGQFSGKADLKLSVTATPDGASGNGSVVSPAVSVFGLKLADVNVPLTFDGNSLKSSGATFAFYGGKGTNTLTFDLKNMRFANTLSANGFDVNAVVQDASGGMGGKISGRGNLSLKIDGSASKSPTYSGAGEFSMGEGGISGFSGLQLVTKLYGLNAVRYQSVTAPFQIQTGKLVLLKGGTATAPAGDPLYKFANIAENGSVTFDKKLNLLINGNINMQLLNALAGGALGGIKDIFGGKNLESALKGALQGGREKGGSADFRDITVKISGTVDKPTISIVKVGGSQGKSEEAVPPMASVDVSPKPQTQPTVPEDILKDKILDAISPPKKQEETPPAPQEDTSTQPDKEQQKPAEPLTPEKKVEQEILKGIDNLFNKKKK